MSEIIVTEFMDEAILREGLAGHEVLYDPGLVDRPADLLALAGQARALIVRNRTQVRGDLLAAATRLEVVGRLGVGLDNIDVEACRERGIAVHPATGANDLSVAEYVLTAALVLLRGAWFATDRVLSGAWPRNDLMGREVSGKVMGLVGFGAIARQVADRARALGMQVMAHDPFVLPDDPAWPLHGVAPMPMDVLLARADVVSLHVPLTAGTRHLIDAGALARMKPDAVLINAARGGVVHEPALADALRARRLGGAALDVFETEPLSAAAAGPFAGCPNLILTPHIAGVTTESNLRVSAVTVEAVARALRARPV